jgi:hypothetical protein
MYIRFSVSKKVKPFKGLLNSSIKATSVTRHRPAPLWRVFSPGKQRNMVTGMIADNHIL